MGEVVHRIDAPLGAGALVRNLADPIERRVAEIDIRRRHVDLSAQYTLAFIEFPAPHALEKVEVLVDRPVAIGALSPWLGQRTAILPNLLCGQMIDIGF